MRVSPQMRRPDKKSGLFLCHFGNIVYLCGTLGVGEEGVILAGVRAKFWYMKLKKHDIQAAIVICMLTMVALYPNGRTLPRYVFYFPCQATECQTSRNSTTWIINILILLIDKRIMRLLPQVEGRTKNPAFSFAVSEIMRIFADKRKDEIWLSNCLNSRKCPRTGHCVSATSVHSMMTASGG